MADKQGSARLSDTAMEAGMGRLLQVGVLLASVLVLVGGVLYLRANTGEPVSYRHFASEPGTLREIAALVRAVQQGEPEAIIQVGLLLLIATPVARVAFAVAAFAVQRDRMYVGISVVVLVVLLVSLFWVG